MKNRKQDTKQGEIENDTQDQFVMGSSSLENDDSIFKEKITSIAFLENKNYISDNLNKEELKFEEDDDENKINIKIYYQKNGINNSKIFALSKDETLKNVLSLFFEENIFKDKNKDHYFLWLIMIFKILKMKLLMIPLLNIYHQMNLIYVKKNTSNNQKSLMNLIWKPKKDYLT